MEENQEQLMELLKKNFLNKKLSREEIRYIKYSNKFKDRFGREPYIVEPRGEFRSPLFFYLEKILAMLGKIKNLWFYTK